MIICDCLGVIPFTEEMLRRGSTVILCANSKPVLNDVTYVELVLLLQQVGTQTKLNVTVPTYVLLLDWFCV